MSLPSDRTFEQGVAHSNRFRPYGNRVPHDVVLAYGSDWSRIDTDTDEQCLATLAKWLVVQGIDPDRYFRGFHRRRLPGRA